MYVPKQFEESRVDVLHGLIRTCPLATVVTNSDGGLNANHIPLLLSATPLPYGTLRGHVAVGNPIVGDLAQSNESLVIFHGPNAYITPSWYATKQTSGKVVPTWNYAVVHAYGVIRLVDDRDWLKRQIEELTVTNESGFDQPWSVSDAPNDYLEKMIGGIVGVEMTISKLIGKWKVSQNQPAENQTSVVDGLKAQACPGSQTMAALVENARNQ